MAQRAAGQAGWNTISLPQSERLPERSQATASKLMFSGYCCSGEDGPYLPFQVEPPTQDVPPCWELSARRAGSPFLGDRNTVHDQLLASSPDARTALLGSVEKHPPHSRTCKEAARSGRESSHCLPASVAWIKGNFCSPSIMLLPPGSVKFSPFDNQESSHAPGKGKLGKPRRAFPSGTSFPTLKWPQTSPITYSFQDHSGERKDPRGG